MAEFTSLDRRWKMSTSPTHVYFVGGPFSQWFRSPFKGKLPISEDAPILDFNCAEQFMMACKAALFADWETLDLIMQTTDPSEQKALGRKVKNFDDAHWREGARECVKLGSYFKFYQNAKLREFLFATGDKILVEGAHYDPVWGVKLAWDDPRILDEANWQGTNWLGECLMHTRTKLYNELLEDIHPGHQR